MDAGGAVQLVTGIREQSPAFLIEYDIMETVDRERLLSAVNRALAVFRAFQVKLALTCLDRRPVYARNTREAEVYPCDGRPHMFGEESGGYLFRVYYAGNRILLSVLHTLTDFFGANDFLKCILCFYFNIANGQPEEIRRLLAVDPEDLRDPYLLYGNPNSPGFSMKNKWHNELFLPNRMLYRRAEPIRVHELIFSISDFLTRSNRAESSIFPFLTWLTGKAVARTYGGEDRLLTGAGSFNCRGMFHSRTPRCFSQTFPTVLHPRERSMDLNRQLTVQRARMDIELEEGTVARSIAARRAQADAMLKDVGSSILGQERLDAERRASARKSTYFLSYLGHIDVGAALDRYIEDVSVLSTVTRVPVVVLAYEWRGLLHFRAQEIGCDNSIAPAALEIAGKLGIACTMPASSVVRLDTFPLEELFHD